MNTGVQRSSATPPAARTATTPAMGAEPGNVFGMGKSVPKIAVAHGIPYTATASVADLHDLERKVRKAMSVHGARYIQIHVPCPLGWGAASNNTIKLARLAIECGLVPIFETEAGKITNLPKFYGRFRARISSCSAASRIFSPMVTKTGAPPGYKRSATPTLPNSALWIAKRRRAEWRVSSVPRAPEPPMAAPAFDRGKIAACAANSIIMARLDRVTQGNDAASVCTGWPVQARP